MYTELWLGILGKDIMGNQPYMTGFYSSRSERNVLNGMDLMWLFYIEV
jgi:hypothetical protein